MIVASRLDLQLLAIHHRLHARLAIDNHSDLGKQYPEAITERTAIDWNRGRQKQLVLLTAPCGDDRIDSRYSRHTIEIEPDPNVAGSGNMRSIG